MFIKLPKSVFVFILFTFLCALVTQVSLSSVSSVFLLLCYLWLFSAVLQLLINFVEKIKIR